jgi:hypothetical protein
LTLVSKVYNMEQGPDAGTHLRGANSLGRCILSRRHRLETSDLTSSEDRFTQNLQDYAYLGLDVERTIHKLSGGLDESPKSPQWPVHGSAIAQSTNSK